MGYLAGAPVKSSKDIPDTRLITALIEWLDPQYDKAAGKYHSDNTQAIQAIQMAHAQCKSQTELFGGAA